MKRQYTMPHDHQEQRRDRRRISNSESRRRSVDFDRAIHNMVAAAAAGAVPSATVDARDHHRLHAYLTGGHQSSDATSTSLVDIINQALDIARSIDIDGLSYAHAGTGAASDSVSVSEDLGNVLPTSTEPNSSSHSNSTVEEDETESGVTSDDGDDDVDDNALEE